jgi:hypothetical protein
LKAGLAAGAEKYKDVKDLLSAVAEVSYRHPQ